MEKEIIKIKQFVKRDCSVQDGNIDRAIELTYKKMTQQWIGKLKEWSKK